MRLTALRVVTAGLAELVLGNFATAAGRQLGIWVAGKSTQVAGKWRLKIFLHVVYDAIKRFATFPAILVGSIPYFGGNAA